MQLGKGVHWLSRLKRKLDPATTRPKAAIAIAIATATPP